MHPSIGIRPSIDLCLVEMSVQPSPLARPAASYLAERRRTVRRGRRVPGCGGRRRSCVRAGRSTRRPPTERRRGCRERAAPVSPASRPYTVPKPFASSALIRSITSRTSTDGRGERPRGVVVRHPLSKTGTCRLLGRDDCTNGCGDTSLPVVRRVPDAASL